MVPGGMPDQQIRDIADVSRTDHPRIWLAVNDMTDGPSADVRNTSLAADPLDMSVNPPILWFMDAGSPDRDVYERIAGPEERINTMQARSESAPDRNNAALHACGLQRAGADTLSPGPVITRTCPLAEMGPQSRAPVTDGRTAAPVIACVAEVWSQQCAVGRSGILHS